MRRVLISAFVLSTAFVLPSAVRANDSLAITNYGISAVSLPWAVALEKGFIKQNGIAIDGIVGSNGGGTTVRNFMASSLPVGVVAVSAAVAAVQTGLDVKFIFSPVNNIGEMGWVAPAGSPVKTIQDLKGKKASFNNPRSTTEMVLRMSLAKAGLTKDVELIASGGQSSGLTLLSQGIVAAANMDEPGIAPPGKYQTIFTVNEYLPNITWEIGITTAEFAKSHPDIVRGLIRAWRQGVDYVYANQDDAAKIYAKLFETSPENAAKIIPTLAQSHYWSPGGFNKDGLQTMLDAMKLVGALDKPFDPVAVIDTSFLPEDLR
jgi:NitT/TauT family transport system substrate-binding protein